METIPGRYTMKFQEGCFPRLVTFLHRNRNVQVYVLSLPGTFHSVLLTLMSRNKLVVESGNHNTTSAKWV